MKPFGNFDKSARGLLLLSVLAGFVAVAAAQHDKKSGSSPAPAYHPSAPQHAPASHSAPPTRAPMTNTRPSNGMGTRPNGTTMGGRTNPSTMGRPGTTTGRTGAPGNMNRPPSSTMNRSNSPGNMNNSRSSISNTHGPITNGSPNSRTPTRANTVNRPLPGRQVSLRGGGSAVIRPNGQIRSITRNGMQINRGINGNRTVVSYHNGARVVTTGRNSGYIQRPYVTRGGNTYVSRTVVVNNVTYTRVYRSYSYGGYCCYYGYRPAYYYAPVYYGWAYNPWPAPVYYSWGWGPAPWYGYYGGYFAPYPVYPSAAFWLTDYLIAANLQAAYQAQAAANVDNSREDQQQPQPSGNDNSGSNSGQVTLTPEVKEAIAEEVKAQLAAQQQASAGTNQTSASTPSQDIPAALDPAHHTFIVASDLTVSSNGQECQLTAGDVIKRSSDTPDEDRRVTAVVSASKKSDCAVGQEIAIGVDDLQEMHNKFEEQLDNGMKDLSEKQGQKGLPKAPDTKTTPSEVPPPAPDNNAAKTLQQQQSAADQSEAQVMKEAFSQGS